MSSRHFVLARITEHVEPLERGERYEDPLTAYLTQHGLGEVTGGGSQLNANGEIEFADVELELVNLDDAITELIQQLDAMGAPFGSSIRFAAQAGRQPIPFGKYEQLTIYLDGTGLPPPSTRAWTSGDSTVSSARRPAGRPKARQDQYGRDPLKRLSTWPARRPTRWHKWSMRCGTRPPSFRMPAWCCGIQTGERPVNGACQCANRAPVHRNSPMQPTTVR